MLKVEKDTENIFEQKELLKQNILLAKNPLGVEGLTQGKKKEKRKSICTSRSFANNISDIDELVLRVSDFAGKCAEKLRKEGTAAGTVGIFLYTNRFREDLDQYYPTATVNLDVPANSASEIIRAALKTLRYVYKPGYEYKKAGVVVTDIVDSDSIQQVLFGFDGQARERNDKISEVMDKVNTSGENLLRLGTQRSGHYADGIRREFRSGLYTTSWADLIEVR